MVKIRHFSQPGARFTQVPIQRHNVRLVVYLWITGLSLGEQAQEMAQKFHRK